MTSYVTKEKYQELLDKYKDLNVEDGNVSITICLEDLEALADRDNIKTFFAGIKKGIRESSKYSRGALLNERGQLLWEEPLDEYEKRMLELKAETGSCIPNIKVQMTGKPLPEGMSECVKGFIVKKKKPSPPPPPPMRKYKSGWFGGETLVNQDEIDEHTAMMDKWREEDLK